MHLTLTNICALKYLRSSNRHTIESTIYGINPDGDGTTKKRSRGSPGVKATAQKAIQLVRRNGFTSTSWMARVYRAVGSSSRRARHRKHHQDQDHAISRSIMSSSWSQSAKGCTRIQMMTMIIYVHCLQHQLTIYVFLDDTPKSPPVNEDKINAENEFCNHIYMSILD